MKPLAKFELEPGVFVTVYPEDMPDWVFEGIDESIRGKIRAGDIYQVFVTVSVFDKSGHVEGTDSLGGIVVGLDDHKQEIRDAIYDHGLIEEARADLKRILSEIKRENPQ